MNAAAPSSPESSDPVTRAAAEWTVRLDRGLTPAEQDAYSQWLAADPRHREAIAEHRWGWDELDRLAGIQDSVHALPDPDLLQPRRRSRPRFAALWPTLLAAAAALALAAFIAWPKPVAEPVPHSPAPSYALAAPIEERQLEDGSRVALNRGAVLDVNFSPAERRVHLVRGEANFTVTRDLARPFVVHAGGVDVRAVGTVFNVRLDPKAVEVIVTEGRVAVNAAPRQNAAPAASLVSAPAPAPAGEQLVSAGERAVVSLATERAPQVGSVSEAEMARALAWQPRLLDFTDAPMSAIVTEFNRRNPVRIVLADAALEQMRLSATFRSDNVEGFVRLMESDFDLRAEWRGETEVMLRRR